MCRIHRLFRHCLALTFSIPILLSPVAEAALTIDVFPSGNDVVAIGYGSANTAGLTSGGNWGSDVFIWPNGGGIQTGSFDHSRWSGITGPANTGTGGYTSASTGSGSAMGRVSYSGELALPQGYVSGTAISGTATWPNATLASLGAVPGSYTWTWGSGPTADSLTINILAASPLVVTTTSDVVNANDGVVSLREAIRYANSKPGADTINFNIDNTQLGASPHVINVSTNLPTISQPVFIDGLSEPDIVGGVSPVGNATNDDLTIQIHASGSVLYGLLFNSGAGGSTVRGLSITGFGSAGAIQSQSVVTISSCYIGVAANGTTAGGNNEGIILFSAPAGSLIGGPNPGDGNVIAYTTNPGISIIPSWGVTVRGNTIRNNAGGGILCNNAGTGNRFQENLIYGNGRLGIDLANVGVTANDANDSDSGSNNLQNFPVLTAAASGSATSVMGSLTTQAGTYTLEFYSSPTDTAQGEKYLGRLSGFTVATTGVAQSFAVGNLAAATVGHYVTATAISESDTATSDNGDTSEFSAGLAIAAPEAPSLIVTTTSDVVNNVDGLTSLREAIAYANSFTDNQPRTVTFSNTTAGGAVNFHDGTARTITLGGSELVISGYVTIDGPGADRIVITGNNASRVLHVETSGVARLNGLTITGGNGGGAVNSGWGGGLSSRGALTVFRCVVTGNTCSISGGGIYSGNPTTIPSTLYVIDSLVSDNTSNSGGIYHSGGVCCVINSTIAKNTGEALRGNGGETIAINCSIVDNQGGITGGVGAGSFRFRNTIIAGNTGTRPNISLSVFSHKSLGCNLIEDTSGSTINPPATGDLYNTAAHLGTLQNNGGPSSTAALQPGSPAINAGGPVSEIQTFTVLGTAGTFTLSVGGQPSAALPYNATASEVKTALEALSPVGSGAVDVQKTGGTFTLLYQGTRAETNLPDLVVNGTGGTTVQAQTLLQGGTPSADQRGKIRPQFSVVDMGAFELGGSDLNPVTANDGALWYLGPPGTMDSLRVYREVAGMATWVDNGTANQIGQAADGTIVVRTVTGDVYLRLGSTTGIGTSYQLATKVTTGDGATWFLGPDGPNANDRLIYRWVSDEAPAYSGGAGTTLSLVGGLVRTTTTGGVPFERTGSNAGLGTEWVNIADAPSLIVTTLSDSSTNTDGQTSLREAIAYANTLPARADITFNIPGGGTIALAAQNAAGSRMLPILTNPNGITIDGANGGQGPIVIDGGSTSDTTGDRVFFIGVGTGEAAAATGFGSLVATTNTAWAIRNLTIQNGNARGGKGGDGADRGGGGAGLGGGVFVNSGTLSLASVEFLSCRAVGGNSGALSNGFNTGGGGLGGNGGLGGAGGNSGRSGGGGFGLGADGGSNRSSGLPGFYTGAAAGGAGSSGGAGGDQGGGAGSGDTGGGGGVGGGAGTSTSGGAGGFGGGGGGGFTLVAGPGAGHGGFGGGGGGTNGTGGNGGFGGGGGSGGFNFGSPGIGGFGAGGAGIQAGGGGLGAGGAVFVRHGASVSFSACSVSGGSVTGGTGENNGQGIGSGVFLSGSATWDVSTGNTVTLADTLGGGVDAQITGGFTKTGAGTLVLSAAGNSHTGGTNVNGGTLHVDGTFTAASSATTVAGGATLAGSGTLAGPVMVESGGTLAPGTATTAGQFGTGVLTFAPGANFAVNLNGATLGSGYDQLTVTGTVQLAGATMEVMSSVTPTAGTVFTVVEATGGITGTFAGLADGTVFTSGQTNYRIDYTTNEVTLTAIIPNLNYRQADAAVDLFTVTGQVPGSGTFSGPGVSGTNGGTFTPGAGSGVLTITFTPTTGSPATFTITVTETPSLTVTATSDITSNTDGLTSLREALAYAMSGTFATTPEVTFDIPTSDPGYQSGTGAWTITLAGTELSFNRSVTITGPGADKMTVSGHPTLPSRIFKIYNRSTLLDVAITGLTLANGRGTETDSSVGGGAIYSNFGGRLTLEHCVLRDNQLDVTNSWRQGGAIWHADALLVLDHCTFTGNRATGANGQGGAVFATGSQVEARSSVFTDNQSGQSGGAVYLLHRGGSILEDCVFTDNRAENQGRAFGGALYAGNSSTLDSIELNRCVFERNVANVTVAQYSDLAQGGAALFNAKNVTIRDCRVDSNEASGTYCTQGGGLFFNSGENVTIHRTSVTRNRAVAGTSPGPVGSIGNGGGIHFVDGSARLFNCTIAENTAESTITSEGGGIYSGGMLTLTNCTVAANTIINSTTATGTVSRGGGIYHGGGAVTLANTIIADNAASGGATTEGPDAWGAFTSSGNNLVGRSDGSSGFSSGGDQSGTTAAPLLAKLGPVAEHGGPVLSVALLADSPAIDAGSNALAVDENDVALVTDQRGTGFARIVKGSRTTATATVDIGSYELFAAPEFTTDELVLSIAAAPLDLAAAAGVSPSGGVFSGPGVSGVFFDPRGLAPGQYIVSYTVTDGFGVENAATLTVTVMSLPAKLEVERPKRFKPTEAGRKAAVQRLRITNTGGSPLTGLTVRMTGPHRRDFRLVRPRAVTIAPSGATVYRLSFKPRSPGIRKATLTVTGGGQVSTTLVRGLGLESGPGFPVRDLDQFNNRD